MIRFGFTSTNIKKNSYILANYKKYIIFVVGNMPLMMKKRISLNRECESAIIAGLAIRYLGGHVLVRYWPSAATMPSRWQAISNQKYRILLGQNNEKSAQYHYQA